MAKLNFFASSVILLVLSAAIMDGSVVGVFAQKRCQERLYNSGCTLSDCGKRCWIKHHEPGYECVANAGKTIYACYCFFTCG